MTTDPFSQPSFYKEMPPEIPLEKWQDLVDLIARLYKAPGAWIMQASVVGIETLVANNDARPPFHPGNATVQDAPVYCRHVITENESLYVPDAAQDNRWSDNPEFREYGYRSYLGIPLQWPDGSVFGTLCTMDTQETDYSDDYIALLKQLKHTLDADLSQLTTTRKLRELSLQDDLTQLTNRRGFMELARKMLQLARRNDFAIAMTTFDLNGLKEINDTFGHQAGDRMIQAFARALKEATRMEDCVARMGGDEFVLLALQKTLPDTGVLVDRVRQTFETLLESDLQIRNPSFCFGSKTYAPTEPFTIDTLLMETDALMYHDKKRFKERIGDR